MRIRTARDCYIIKLTHYSVPQAFAALAELDYAAHGERLGRRRAARREAHLRIAFFLRVLYFRG